MVDRMTAFTTATPLVLLLWLISKPAQTAKVAQSKISLRGPELLEVIVQDHLQSPLLERV